MYDIMDDCTWLLQAPAHLLVRTKVLFMDIQFHRECAFDFLEVGSFLLPYLRPDFTSKLVHVLAFGTPKFYIAPYDKIKHKLVNLSSNCDVKSDLKRCQNGSFFLKRTTVKH